MSAMKVWAVTEGPLSAEEVDYDDNFEEDHPKECGFFNICKVEEGGKLVEKEVWFTDLSDAYRFKHYIDSQMEAVVIEDEGILDYKDCGYMI